MKRQSLYFLVLLYIGLSASGCGNEIAMPETEDKLVPITFSSEISTSVNSETATQMQTKAESADPLFPNNGKIAVLAANATSTTINAGGWAENNLLLNHSEATANAWNGTSFPVTINDATIYYWPFNPNEYLTFTAYSPATDATMKRKKDINSLKDTELQIEVNTTNAKFPDLLYSSPTSCWNKTHGNVSLTQFKHAMARLVIKVVGIDKKGNEIKDYANAANLKITKLNVLTKATKVIFDFTTPAWTLTSASADFHILHSFNVTPNDKGKLPYDSSKEQEIYILPSTDGVNTVELSKVDFEIKDAVLTYGKTEGYQINEFKDDKSTPVSLKMGETTVLTFKIRVMEVSTGDTENIVLKGDLADWDYKGESSVTIN
ncbi:hypothetical protein [Bacteroides sp.]|uniref:hypothetical protein n=1 Tax=Bacteroides sp. TaxID=29523 RepID=UPI002633D5D1|nr:hypothetical protein [Bacteroides sp.]